MRLNSGLNIWYLDDGSLGDHLDVVLNDFILLNALSKEIGLDINPSKCEIFFCFGEVDYDVLRKFQSVAPGMSQPKKI